MLRYLRTFTAVLVLLAVPPDSGARIWTSVSGNTVDAELAGREGTFVILKRPNGSQIKIDVQKLSATDQTFLAQGKAMVRDPGGSTAVQPDAGLGPITFQSPHPMTTDQISGFTAQVPDSAGYLGLQFGPTADDVLYMMFDPPAPLEVPQNLYLYSPNHRLYATPRKLAGKRGKHGENRVTRFNKIQVASQFGSLQATFDFELTAGIERTEILAMVIEVQLFDGGKPSRFVLGGYINEKILIGPGEIPVLPILSRPSLRTSVRTTTLQPTVNPGITMGSFRVQPVGRKIALSVVAESGKVVEKLKHEVSEEELLAFSHGGPRIPLIDVKAGTTYTLRASADMGSPLGVLTDSKVFTTRSARQP